MADIETLASPQRPVAEVSKLDLERMEAAYLEYRKACYHVIYQHALERGFFDQVKEPTTVDELIRSMGCRPERRETVALFLRAMARFGVLHLAENGSDPRYRCDAEALEQDVEFDLPLLSTAIGQDHVESLIHSRSYAGVIDSFYQELNPIAVDFVNENIKLWDEFLNTPFYRYSRDRAVAAVARPGGRVLDLACGPGFSLLSNSDRVGERGLVVGFERSRDFVAQALERTKERPNVRIVQGDLEEPLDFLQEGSFDGAMIVGAFHFLQNRDGFFAQVSRLLAPGGRLCVGYVYSENGSYDQELMDLRFYLREPPSRKSSVQELTELAAGNRLSGPIERFSLGCFEWCLFERPE